MRHTLLPDNERLAMHREYRVRLAIVFVIMLVVAGVIGIASLFPAFIHATSIEKSGQMQTASLLASESKEATAMKSELSSDSAKLAMIIPYTKGPLASGVIDSIIKLRGDIKITSISFARAGGSQTTLTIQGTAPTRASLLSFRAKIEAIKDTSVELPVSELTKSTDLSFSMQVIQKLP